MQTEDAPELTPEFLEDLRRYTEYGWGPGITAALLNRWHPVALTNLDVIRLRRRLGRAAAPAQDAGSVRVKATKKISGPLLSEHALVGLNIL